MNYTLDSTAREAHPAVGDVSTNLEAAWIKNEPIAIVGLACRFPGASNEDEYWRLLVEARSAISPIPQIRRDGVRLPNSSTKGGFLNAVDQFDAGFFGISAREAAAMDPQQRLLLEVSWEALENAGIPVERLAGSDTGVFIGVMSNDYEHLHYADAEAIDGYSYAGYSFVPNRLSYLLDFRGPSVAIDSACSSSLAAVHYACQSLRALECKTALAGGVNLILTPYHSIAFSRWGMLSPDGECRTFDERANGFVRAEGCGVVVLKRLADALAAGDSVLALVRGSALNQDGRTNVFTAPSGLAQRRAIQSALAQAGVLPEQVEFVEAHGTGTRIGDPIEMEALSGVYGGARAGNRRCWIGAVKTNIGHLESAAGIAGLIKAVLCLRHGAIPPNLNFARLNPHISLKGTALKLPIGLTVWSAAEGSRYAGVSSFGAGGTNAHVVLGEAPLAVHKASPEPAGGIYILPISARAPEALSALAREYTDFLIQRPELNLYDICYTAAVRRSHHRFRQLTQGRSREELIKNFGGQNRFDNPAAAAYLAGRSPDWSQLFAKPGKPLRLPNYPWQKQRYWITAGTAKPKREYDHVLLGTRFDVAALPGCVFEWQWKPADDHCVRGVPVARAAFFVEMILAAGSEYWSADARALSLSRLSLHEPLASPRDAGHLTVQLTLITTNQAEAEVRIQSREARSKPWVLHATAVLRVIKTESEHGMNFGTSSPICRKDAALRFRARLREAGLDDPSSDAATRGLSASDGVVIARFEAESLSRPAAIDAAMQTLLAGQQFTSRLYLPIEIEQIRFWEWPGTRYWSRACAQKSRAPAAEIVTGDVTLFSDDGELLCEVKGLTLKAAVPVQRQGSPAVYGVDWRRVESPGAAPVGRWLVVGDRNGFGHQLQKLLNASEQQLYRGILYLGGLGITSPAESELEPVFEDLNRILKDMLAKPLAGAPRLWLVAQGAQNAPGTASLAPWQAPLLGIGRTLASELPDLWGGLLDIDSLDPVQIVDALRLADLEDEIAVRGDELWVPRLVERKLQTFSPLICRPDAAYLITGGLGALGLRTVAWLRKHDARHLFLVGRTGPSDEVAQFLDRLSGADGRIEFLGGDVANEGDLKAMLAHIAANGLVLRGVVHSAGVLVDGLITGQSWERFARALPSKVAGAWNLHRLTCEAPLDFFILYSSVASLLGSAGQSNYAAANAFLDALAAYRRAEGLPALSVNWGPWESEGMAARLDAILRQRVTRRGLQPMPADVAMKTYERLVTSGAHQAAVLDIDWSAYFRELPGRLPARLADLGKGPPSERGRSTLRLDSVPIRARRGAMVEFLRRAVSDLLECNPELIRARQNLFDAGMDSLLSVELRNRLQADLGGVALPASLIFDYPRLDELADYLLSKCFSEICSEV